MTMNKFKKNPIKKKAKVALYCALIPFAWLIDNAVKAASYLLSRRKAVLSCVLAAVMLLTMMPTLTFTASAATNTATYTGLQGSVTLSSGSYLLDGATFTVANGQNGIAIAAGATVTLYISGTVTVKAGGAANNGDGGKAGIYVPSGATLTVLKADGATSAVLNVTGGNGGKAFTCGAGGGGAAIGTNGGIGGAPGSGNGANGGNGQSASIPGTIGISSSVALSLTVGTGGGCHSGFNGSSGWLGLSDGKDCIRAGNGGGGGGGAAYDGASIGTGGGAGGAGGNGGKGGYQDEYNNWSECGGGGGGGGGQGRATFVNNKQSGYGGGGGGAAVVVRGGEHSNVGAGGKGASDENYTAGGAEKIDAKGTLRTVEAYNGTGGNNGDGYNPCLGGEGGSTSKDDHPGSNGGNGGLSGTPATEYTSVEINDSLGKISFYTVKSGSTLGTLTTTPNHTSCYTFNGWYHGSAKVTESTTVTGTRYILTAAWISKHIGSYTTSWSADCSNCTQTLKCSVCGQSFTEKANSTCTVKQPLTCTQNEIKEYTATFTNINFDLSHKTITTITTKNASGHIYNSYGLCTVCDKVKEDFLTANANGYYEIDSVNDLMWFAAYVNAVNNTANAVLLTELSLDNSFLHIGTATSPYSGTFNGGGNTLTVNYNVTTEKVGGLFDYARGATIKNLNMTGSITTSNKFAGGLIGYLPSSGSVTKIENVLSEVNITSTFDGDNTHGGIVGVSDSPITMTNCGYSGKIIALYGTNCGGLNGWASKTATFTNCYMAGEVSLNSISGSATFCRANSSITLANCYYLTAYGTTQGTQKTANEFFSGEVTYLLNGSTSEGDLVWGQTIGTDTFPVFLNNNTVYFDAASSTYYNENSDAISVTITWGAMEFTYTDASEGEWNSVTCAYENPAPAKWTCDTGADKITVTSESNVELTASFSYLNASGMTVNGSFTDDTTLITAPVPLAKGDITPQSVVVYFKLDGKPEETADKAVMGTVTVTIGG